MRRTAGALLLAVSLTACGSTVQVTTDRTVVGDGLTPPAAELDGTGTTGSTVPGTSSSTGGLRVGGTTGSTGTTGVAAPGTSGTGTATTGSTTYPSSASTGLGVTAKTITIGFSYSGNSDEANAAIGASGITSGDDHANAIALRDEINEHGGIAGRKLQIVFHAYDSNSTAPGSSQDQAACTDYTQDNKVLAAFTGNLSDVLPTCLRKAGVVQLKSGVIVDEDSAYLRQFPGEFLLATIAQDRALRDQVGSLVRQRWFTPWNTVRGVSAPTGPVKLGVLAYNTSSSHRAVAGTLLPALRAAGHSVAANDVHFVQKVGSQSDVSATVAQVKSATLKLQQSGVTHVVLDDQNGLLLGFFATNARTQGYYPRLGVTSGAGVQAIHDTGLVQSNQLNGLGGNSWMPPIDLPARDSGTYGTSETKRCLAILKRRTGQTFDSTNAATIALGTCNQFFLFQKAMARATSLSPQGLARAIESLGDSYVSPLLPRARFTAQQHDEGVQGWDLTWVSSCSCVRYGSPHVIS